ncbi:MAG: hypothetical protein JW932_05320 [Deltaproteobacteria bacterium]|nr:hypothetical protein [Deltaproteobacteria bacterium]
MLSKDFKEFIELLNKNSVKYLVIGGYAVALHGHPRYTKDIDIWIQSSQENAAQLLRALEEFGFGSLDLQVDDFIVPNQIIQLGYPPNRIDLLTSAAALDFEECYQVKKSEIIDGVQIDFIDSENLKRNKKAIGRKQDLADIENLQ